MATLRSGRAASPSVVTDSTSSLLFCFTISVNRGRNFPRYTHPQLQTESKGLKTVIRLGENFN